MHMPIDRSISIHAAGDRGVALITTMMIMMLMSALMIGLTTTVMSDQRFRYIDRDRAKAFYGANSGLEKLTAELANLFFVNVAPTDAQIAALKNEMPSVPDVTFVTSGRGAYGVLRLPSPIPEPIATGPYAGLIALKNLYEMHSSVRTTDGGEAHLKRKIETVAIPVFQFGMFSDVDLSFHAGPNFNFGGRIHTNGNLFIGEGDGNTLTLPEKVTAVKDIIRRRLVNGVAVSVSDHEGTISMATAPGAFRNLALTEGSLTDGLGSAVNPSWSNVSLSAYNGYIRNGKTGAKALNLPLLTSGGSNTDLVRRPPPGENVTNETLYGERFFSKVSLRILLSDAVNGQAPDITSLPGVTATAPVLLDGDWTNNAPNNGTAYGPVSATNPPIARSPGPSVGPLTVNNPGGIGTGGNPNIVITTNQAIPAYFKMPVLRFTPVPAVPAIFWDPGCTGRNVTAGGVHTFTGCTPPGIGLPAGGTVTATVATVNGNVPLSTVTTATWAAASTTITVADTSAFAPRTFWVENPVNGANVLVTCTGYTAPAAGANSFSGCNITAGIENGATITNAAAAAAGTGLIGGFIKVERHNIDGSWTDVTMEMLNYGIGDRNLAGRPCGDPTPNAILRIQRLRDNADPTVAGPCTYAGSTRAEDYWPNTLFDTREGLQRDVNPNVAGTVRLGGVIHYVALDVRNLSQWFVGAGVYANGSGPGAMSTTNGYSVYFSDRRNNRNATNLETGEYGFEDVVNPATATGTPNAALDVGEDVNANALVETYGQFPSYNGLTGTVPPGALFPLDATARPTTDVRTSRAQVNRALLFRYALKLINGGLGNIVAPGLTIATENPVYVQGDWNANAAGFGNPHVATSIIADGVTLLSNNWNDLVSFSSPYTPGNRVRSAQSYYRVAIIAGKNAPFPNPATGPVADFGTDGGAHNFLRMLEAGGGTVNYRGSIATFYYSRQAVGTYKGGVTVYGAPTRAFNFDTDFLHPELLPPLTPVFRDLNSLGFTQEFRPGY